MNVHYIRRESAAASLAHERADDRETVGAGYAALGIAGAVVAVIAGAVRGAPPPLLALAGALLLLFGIGAALIEFREARRLRKHARELARYARGGAR